MLPFDLPGEEARPPARSDYVDAAVVFEDSDDNASMEAGDQKWPERKQPGDLQRPDPIQPLGDSGDAWGTEPDQKRGTGEKP